MTDRTCEYEHDLDYGLCSSGELLDVQYYAKLSELMIRTFHVGVIKDLL